MASLISRLEAGAVVVGDDGGAAGLALLAGVGSEQDVSADTSASEVIRKIWRDPSFFIGLPFDP